MRRLIHDPRLLISYAGNLILVYPEGTHLLVSEIYFVNRTSRSTDSIRHFRSPGSSTQSSTMSEQSRATLLL